MSETDNYSDSASPKELLERAKNEFNREKRLIVKNLPPTTSEIFSEKDIRSFMGLNGEFPIEDVTIVKQNNQAIVTLKDPSMVDDAIFMVDNTELNDCVVSVTKYRSDKMLCIAHLPLTMTEYEFRELAAQHGSLEKCFLMRSEDTGCSKGYGFVEYNETIETVGQIKYKLDGSNIQGCVVHCDALTDTSQTGISFQDLHSKCLLINNLPKDYKDSIKLRELFSSLVKPVYCQIVSKEGESLGFGILEYDKWEDAERACQHFNKHEINGVPINVSFCIPGKSAVHMFTRIMFKYGDTVHVNRASLLPDPVYPNPAFLKHIFFKTHCAKHPRLLVQFTDNLLHLQEGYVRQLEDKTNTKPGILGPAPSIPMSPLMDINLQLGLLSLIVLDMREKGTYSGEVPDPLGKVKIPTEDEFQQKNEPVSLLGDPLTAQANILLRNILMPDSGPQLGLLEKKETVEENEAKLLGKPVKSLNLVHMCSFGRLMAMLTENNQSTGLLGNRPNAPVDNGGPKPLIEGLMQAGKMAQSLLNSMGMGQPKQINSLLNVDLGNMPNNMSNNMMANQGNSNNNAVSNAATNFMNTIQNLAMQKMSESKQGGPQLLNALFGNKSGGDGLLGDYQGPSGQSNQNTQMMGKGPKPLLGMNLGDGLMPTPTNVKSENNFFGNQGNYDDSGYQGGYDDSDLNDGFGDRGFGRNLGNNRGMRGNMGPSGDMRQFGNQGGMNAGNKRFGQQGFRGNQDNMGQNNEINYSMDKDYNNIAQQAAAYAAGAAAAYKQQYEEYMAHAGYGSGYGGYDDNYNYNNNSGYGSDYNNYDYGSNAAYRGGNYGAQSSGSYSTGMSSGGRSSYNSYSGYGTNDSTNNAKSNYSGYNNTGRMGQNGGYNAANNSSGGNFVFGSNNVSGSASATSGYGGSGMGSAGRFGSMGGGFDAQSSRDPRIGGFGSQGSSTGKMGPPLPPGTGPGPSLPGMSTPQGQKRTSMHMLPSPEPSPEGDYIGQHSQGIGGHYADSYTKRQKLVGRFQ